MDTIFVSWSRETRPIADAIGQWLQVCCASARAWMSDVDIVAGQKWRLEIDKALKTAQCSLVCIGPSAISSPWVLYEAGAIGASKALVPIALLVPYSKLPPVLSDIQVLSAFEPETSLVNERFPDQLRRALATLVPSSQCVEDAAADTALLGALGAFADARTRQLVERLRVTKRADTLVEVLRYVHAHPNVTPRNLAESGVLCDILGKKFLVALAIFWLEKQGLLEVDDFDNLTDGKAMVSLSGRLVLMAKEYQ